MDVLGTYLRNHWAAAAGGADLADRVAGSHRGDEVGGVLASVADDVREDRARLRALLDELEVSPGLVGPLVARVAERAGRLKPNGRVVRRSPVSDLLEVEALRSAVLAKRAGWEALQALDAGKPPRQRELRLLQERADSQVERLTQAHQVLSARVLGGRPAGPLSEYGAEEQE